jgi:Fe-S cluster assembly protein SufD
MASLLAKQPEIALVAALPTPDMERWKYTNLASAVKAMPGAVSPAPVAVTGGDKFVQRLGNVFPAGVPAWLTALGRDDTRGGSMALWQLGATQQNDGIMIDVPAGKAVDAPVEMTIQGIDGTFFIPHTVIRLGAGASLTLIEKHNGNGRHWNNSVMEIAVGADATLNHIRLQENGGQAVYTQNTYVRVEGGGRYDAFTLTTGSLLSRNEILVELAGWQASCSLNGVNLLGGKQHGDTTITVAHMAPDCASNQFYRTILKDQAHGVFQGKVHVHKGAQGTDGYQLSNAILLSEGAEMDTKPELEIYADDVKCSHGATTGALDEEAMFYMRSRGLGEEEARAVLLSAFVNSVVDKIGDDGIKHLISQRIYTWLQS